MTKTFACIFMFVLATTLQSAFAQTPGTPAPSPLHSTPDVKPAPSVDTTAPQAKPRPAHHGRKSGASPNGAPNSQNN
jgi:hypothetical protein